MQRQLSRFTKIFFWEFLQNLPIVLGFLLALEAAKQANWWLTVLFCLSGSVLGALTIRFTESQIVPGEKEPIPVTLTNMVSFFVIAGLVAIYFAQAWGAWQTDALIGLGLGVVVGYGQDLAAGKKQPGIRHILALSAAFIPALVAIRYISELLPPFWGSIMLTLLITQVIVMIDYLQNPV